MICTLSNRCPIDKLSYVFVFPSFYSRKYQSLHWNPAYITIIDHRAMNDKPSFQNSFTYKLLKLWICRYTEVSVNTQWDNHNHTMSVSTLESDSRKLLVMQLWIQGIVTNRFRVLLTRSKGWYSQISTLTRARNKLKNTPFLFTLIYSSTNTSFQGWITLMVARIHGYTRNR